MLHEIIKALQKNWRLAITLALVWAITISTLIYSVLVGVFAIIELRKY